MIHVNLPCILKLTLRLNSREGLDALKENLNTGRMPQKNLNPIGDVACKVKMSY